MSEESYQGWKNPETWCVVTHLNNSNENVYSYWVEYARECVALEEFPTAILAESLRSFVEDSTQKDSDIGEALSSWALVRVDWMAIADSYLEIVQELEEEGRL